MKKNGKAIEVATSATNVLEEYFSSHGKLKLDGGPRLMIR